MGRLRQGLRGFGPLGLALLLAVIFRWPPLLNASGINSDAAVPGLQAMHILRGEWAGHLWGAGYQAALDPLVIAAFFALFGVSARTMMLVPLVFLLLQIAMTYDVVKRRVSRWAALVAVSGLVFATMVINMPMTYVMRQVMITTLVAGVWCADKSTSARRPVLWLLLSAVLTVGGLFNDYFALVMLPSIALFALLCAWEGEAGARPRMMRLTAWAVPFVVLVAVALTFHSEAPRQPLMVERLTSNARLLIEQVLPFAFGYRVYASPAPNVFQPWALPVAVTVMQKIAAGLAAALWLLGSGAFFCKQVPWPTRRLALLGTGCGLAALTAFLLSTQPSDMWSARYLAPLVWMAPFTFAPLIAAWGAKRVGALLLPYLASVAVAGWSLWGTYVDGPWPKLDARGSGVEEKAVRDFLREQGVEYAAAQYWVAYRLSFLFEEKPVVVPFNPSEDRYVPYRQGFNAAKKMALIFHPSEFRASPAPYEMMLRNGQVPYEKHEVAGFTVLIVSR